MKAGRELDALIAEKVMGWRLVTEEVDGKPTELFRTPDGRGHFHYEIPRYSTGDAAALEVLGVLRKSGKWCCLKIVSDYDYVWDVVLVLADHESGTRFKENGESEKIRTGPNPDHKPTISVTKESLAHAICLAALKAVS